MIPAIRCRSAASACTNWNRSAKKTASTFSSTLLFKGSKRIRITNDATIVLKKKIPRLWPPVQRTITPKISASTTPTEASTTILPSSSLRSRSRCRWIVCERKYR